DLGPNLGDGQFYIYVKTDDYLNQGYNFQPEVDETNNVSAGVGLMVGAPDLTATVNSLTPDPAGISGTLRVNYTVSNLNNVVAPAQYWYDTVYLSKSNTFDNTAIPIAARFIGYRGVDPLL